MLVVWAISIEANVSEGEDVALGLVGCAPTTPELPSTDTLEDLHQAARHIWAWARVVARRVHVLPLETHHSLIHTNKQYSIYMSSRDVVY